MDQGLLFKAARNEMECGVECTKLFMVEMTSNFETAMT
jgi:hypothetical protein